MERSMRASDRNAMVNKARELRRSASPPESLLWQQLRRRPSGLKFRRQHPFGPFIADFYCPAIRLIVEVDGDSHDMGDRPMRDARRDEWLREHGLRVVRFTAADVMKDVGSAVTAILRVAKG
jgi:very-short-patch-repair endonuclease